MSDQLQPVEAEAMARAVEAVQLRGRTKFPMVHRERDVVEADLLAALPHLTANLKQRIEELEGALGALKSLAAECVMRGAEAGDRKHRAQSHSAREIESARREAYSDLGDRLRPILAALDSPDQPPAYHPALECVCGHTAHWHGQEIGAPEGSGECEYKLDCGCKRFLLLRPPIEKVPEDNPDQERDTEVRVEEEVEGDEEGRCWPLYVCRRCGHHGDWWSMTQPPYRCEKRVENGAVTAQHGRLEMVEVVPAERDSRLTKEAAAVRILDELSKLGVEHGDLIHISTVQEAIDAAFGEKPSFDKGDGSAAERMDDRIHAARRGLPNPWPPIDVHTPVPSEDTGAAPDLGDILHRLATSIGRARLCLKAPANVEQAQGELTDAVAAIGDLRRYIAAQPSSTDTEGEK